MILHQLPPNKASLDICISTSQGTWLSNIFTSRGVNFTSCSIGGCHKRVNANPVASSLYLKFWTKTDYSLIRFYGIHLRAILLLVPKWLFCIISQVWKSYFWNYCHISQGPTSSSISGKCHRALQILSIIDNDLVSGQHKTITWTIVNIIITPRTYWTYLI